MKDDRLTSKLLVGALIGAIFGLAAVWIIVNRKGESQGYPLDVRALKLNERGSKGKRKDSVTLGEVLGLGLSVMKVARQAGELVRRA